MAITGDVKARIQELIAQVPTFVRGHGSARAETLPICAGWVAAAHNIVQMACVGSPRTAYLTQVDRLQAKDYGYAAGEQVLSIAEILKHLLVDLDKGLLVDMARQISGETYDDLLDHAEAYLREGRKDPAGVIVGVVFEDTVRRLCDVHGLDHAGKTVDPLIQGLKMGGHITGLEGKEALVAAGLRNSATHAKWDAFQADQVKTVLEFTRRLIRDKLAT